MNLIMRELARIGRQAPYLPDKHKPTKYSLRGEGRVLAVLAKPETSILRMYNRSNSIVPLPIDTMEYTFGCAAPGRDYAHTEARHATFKRMMVELGERVEPAQQIYEWVVDPRRPLYLTFGPGSKLEHVQALAGMVLAPIKDVRKGPPVKLIKDGVLATDSWSLAAFSMALDATLATHPGIGPEKVEEARGQLARGEFPLTVEVLPVLEKDVAVLGPQDWWLDPIVTGSWRAPVSGPEVRGTCAICGQTAVLARTHEAAGGKQLCSSNAPTTDHYGQKKGYVSPACEDCANAYVRGLDRILRASSLRAGQYGQKESHSWWPADWSCTEDEARDLSEVVRAIDKPWVNPQWWANLNETTPRPGPGWHLGLADHMARWAPVVGEWHPGVTGWGAALRWRDALMPDWDGAEAPYSPMDVAQAVMARRGGRPSMSDVEQLQMGHLADKIRDSILADQPLPLGLINRLYDIIQKEGLSIPSSTTHPTNEHFRAVEIRRKLINLVHPEFYLMADCNYDMTTLTPQLRVAYRLGVYLSSLCAMERKVNKPQRDSYVRFRAVLNGRPLTGLIQMHARVQRLASSKRTENIAYRQEELGLLFQEIMEDREYLKPLSSDQRALVELGYLHDKTRRIDAWRAKHPKGVPEDAELAAEAADEV